MNLNFESAWGLLMIQILKKKKTGLLCGSHTSTFRRVLSLGWDLAFLYDSLLVAENNSIVIRQMPVATKL